MILVDTNVLLDVVTTDGGSFRGIADEDLTTTEFTQLAPGQQHPVRYRPAIMDHYVALARDVEPAEEQLLTEQIAGRNGD